MFKKLIVIIGLITTLLISNVRVGAAESEVPSEVVNEAANEVANEIVSETANAEIEPLKGSVTVINLKSDKIKHYPEKDQFVATGNVIIDVEDQNTRIESDEVIYDKTNEKIISEKNVKITKHGTVVYGDYASFDLTKDSALIGNPDADLTKIKIQAKTAEIVSEDLELLKGRAILNEKDMVMMLSTGSFGRKRNNGLFQNKPTADPRFKYNIKAKEIDIEQHDYYNIITMKNASISINKFHIATVPVLQLSTEKETNRIETMLPEFGHQRELGAYFGHGHVFQLFKGDTLKVLPIFAWGDGDIGVGGMGRYMSKTNRTEVLYSTVKNKFVVQGEQDLNFISPDTIIQYGTNAYISNGFFGDQMAQYLIEVVDQRKIAEAYNFRFDLRSSGGFAEELGNYSTGKFQLQGNLANVDSLLGYKDYAKVGPARITPYVCPVP